MDSYESFELTTHKSGYLRASWAQNKLRILFLDSNLKLWINVTKILILTHRTRCRGICITTQQFIRLVLLNFIWVHSEMNIYEIAIYEIAFRFSVFVVFCRYSSNAEKWEIRMHIKRCILCNACIKIISAFQLCKFSTADHKWFDIIRLYLENGRLNNIQNLREREMNVCILMKWSNKYLEIYYIHKFQVPIESDTDAIEMFYNL